MREPKILNRYYPGQIDRLSSLSKGSNIGRALMKELKDFLEQQSARSSNVLHALM